MGGGRRAGECWWRGDKELKMHYIYEEYKEAFDILASARTYCRLMAHGGERNNMFACDYDDASRILRVALQGVELKLKWYDYE